MTIPFDPTQYAAPRIDPNAPMQRLGSAISGAFSAPIEPVAPGTMGPISMPGAAPPPAAPSAHPMDPAGFPLPTPGHAEQAAPAGEGFPIPTPGHADQPQQPALIPSTTTETTKSTTGPDAATTSNINAATADANSAAQAGSQARVNQTNATADFERNEAQSQYGRGVSGYFERAAEMQVQDDIVRETADKLESAAKFKPDRTALFHGDTGTLFGISAAVAAMAGGWLMGQGLTGGKNPYLETVMRMIDDNANDQIQANSQVYQELTRRLGSAEAAKRELKARMSEALGQTIEAKTRFEKADLVQKGAASIMADVQAETAKNRLEAAKLTGQTTTKTVQSRTQMVANPAANAGIDLTNPKEYERVGKVADLQNFAAEAEGLIKSGEMAANIGLLDESWNWITDATRTRSPAQAKVEAVKARWETAMRAQWASEPNGQEVQRRLSLINWPRNDQEIPAFQQAVRGAMIAADPGGRYQLAARAMGNRPAAVEARRIPVVQEGR